MLFNNLSIFALNKTLVKTPSGYHSDYTGLFRTSMSKKVKRGRGHLN